MARLGKLAESYGLGTVWVPNNILSLDPYIHDVVDSAEAQLVLAHSKSFTSAYHQRTPDIPGVPESILRR